MAVSFVRTRLAPLKDTVAVVGVGETDYGKDYRGAGGQAVSKGEARYAAGFVEFYAEEGEKWRHRYTLTSSIVEDEVTGRSQTISSACAPGLNELRVRVFVFSSSVSGDCEWIITPLLSLAQDGESATAVPMIL